jgi:hypothetical protein
MPRWLDVADVAALVLPSPGRFHPTPFASNECHGSSLRVVRGFPDGDGELVTVGFGPFESAAEELLNFNREAYGVPVEAVLAEKDPEGKTDLRPFARRRALDVYSQTIFRQYEGTRERLRRRRPQGRPARVRKRVSSRGRPLMAPRTT